MNRSLLSVAIALGLVFGVGCGSSPEGVCKKLGKLADEAKLPAEKDGGPNCVKKFEELKKADEKQFECLGGCADKATYNEATSCMRACPPTPLSAVQPPRPG